MQVIKKFSAIAPNLPGVYKMLDASGNHLYVGKAKNIKKRIQQYLKPCNNRIFLMLEKVTRIDFFTTKNELEALVVEAKLIRSLQPKYNILLRDDKSYPYLAIFDNHNFPRIAKYRGKRKKGCYGPFVSNFDMAQTIFALQKAFKLRPCSDSFFASRKSPCLEYQIQRCSAPCVGKISEQEYKKQVLNAKLILSGSTSTFCKSMEKKMHSASQSQNYESAKIYRDRINALRGISSVNFDDSEEADYIAVYEKRDEFCIEVISFNKESGFGNYRYFLDNIEDNNKIQALYVFLAQFWPQKHSKIIYTNLDITDQVQNAVDTIFDKKIKILTPKQGIKYKMVQWAYQNARLALQKKLSALSNTQEKLIKLQQAFDIENAPNRIEVYDNSHISGQFAVGVMIVFDKDGFNKKEYRCFKIKHADPCDDYAMMQEVFTRRFKDLNAQKSPDFILIDGGLGHFGAVHNLISNNIDFACIAKGEKRNAGQETFFSKNNKNIKITDKDLLHFLQTIRDEAHRFAITTHRKIRQKSVSKSQLDQIPGVGPIKKRLLLKKFGSVASIAKASIKDLATLDGINQIIARNVLDHLNNSNQSKEL